MSKTKFNHLFAETLSRLGLSYAEAGEKCGHDMQWMGRRIRGTTKISDQDLLLICGSLNITADQVIDIPIKVPNPKQADDVMIDSVIMFVREACEKYKVTASKEQKGKWATFVFTVALELDLSFHQTRGLALLLVKSSKKL